MTVIEIVGTPRAIVLALLVLAALIASTWKQLVQSLYIGLTGREWIIKTNGFLALSFLVDHRAHPRMDQRDQAGVQAALWDCVAVDPRRPGRPQDVRRRLDRRTPLPQPAAERPHADGRRGRLGRVVFALYGVLVWLVDTPFIPRYVLALIAILAIPLARLSAAPLALAWNRHR